MSDRVKRAITVRAKQHRVARRISVVDALHRRYAREFAAYQTDLKELVDGMSAVELASYHKKIWDE